MNNLQEKIVHLSNGDWQVQSEKGRNMGTYNTKKEAEKRLGQVEYFKHMNEEVSKDLETKVRNIIKDFDDEKNSRLSIIEYDDGYDGFVEEFGEDENGHKDIIDFGVFTLNKLTDEEIENGRPVITFLLSGGLNGSGDWIDYLKDISKLFKRFKEELGLHAIVYKLDTDIADDVWTAEVLLYLDMSEVKESLTEDLIVISKKHAKEALDEIKAQIEASKDWKVRKNLLTLMNIYLFQTIYEADHQDETGCDINKAEWDEYSDWLTDEGKKLYDEHPELEKEEEAREKELEDSVSDDNSEEAKNLTESIRKILTEGCWGMPYSLEKVNKLKDLMQRPVDAFTVGDCANYNDELGIGDDTLFDNIADYRHKHKYGSKEADDVRKVIQDFIKNEVLPNWDGYSYSSPEGDYEGHTWEDGVKEVFQEIADMDLEKATKEWKKKMEEKSAKIAEIQETSDSVEEIQQKVAELDEELTEASTLTPLEKMQAFNDGRRRENVKACGDEKLINYYKICLNNNLNHARRELEAELTRRGLTQYIKHVLSFPVAQVGINTLDNDDKQTFIPFIVSNLDNLDAIVDTCEKRGKFKGTAYILVSYVLAVLVAILKNNQTAATKIKDYVLEHFVITLDEFKDLLKRISNESAIKTELAVLLNQLSQVTEEVDVDEDIEKHDTLNPKLFDGDKLKPEVREKALEIVDIFLDLLNDSDIKINVKDIIITGSNASYNYTKDSDVDLHIIVSTKDLDCPANLYPKIYDAYKSMFNSKYDISFYGIPVEIYVESEDTPAVSNGIYSVMNDTWVQEPTETTIPEINWEEFEKVYEPWEKEYQDLIARYTGTADLDETPIDAFINKLYELRVKGLAEEGQYGFSNLIFKELRNRGHLDELKKLKNEIIANRLSLESFSGINVSSFKGSSII